jgi:hypothetical protein
MGDKLRVLKRGSDVVLAEHYTPVRRGVVATTLETVRCSRPERVSFRLVEEFVLQQRASHLCSPCMEASGSTARLRSSRGGNPLEERQMRNLALEGSLRHPVGL